MKNDLKSIEAILASWTPRRPSPALKDRIFGPKPEKDPVEVGFRMTWLAPASVAFVATFLALGQTPSTLTLSPRLAQAISDPELASYMAAHSPHNSFDNTVGSIDVSFSSTTPPSTLSTHMSLLGTNSVRP
ncbi:MAG: hypothetical protein JNN07_02200 [Verrucomicrobiales bacterium]|nr:hypothetical protein [Verrucomicrobiales bacterium]